MVAGNTFLDLYNQYMAIPTSAKKYTYRRFLGILHKQFPEIVKSRQTQFAQCSLCNLLQSLRAKADVSDAHLEKIEACFEQHIQHMLLQRQLYTKRIHFSVADVQAISLAIDTMSQFKTQFPRLKGRQTSDTKDLAQLACATTLSRVHGVLDYFYLNNGAYPKDSNYISGLLIDTLLRVAESFTSKGRPWPRMLFLQVCSARSHFQY